MRRHRPEISDKQRVVVHPHRASAALMLDVAARALLGVGVEARRLLAAEVGVRMAGDALLGFDSHMRRVAAQALAAERRVCLRKRPGADEPLPSRDLGSATAVHQKWNADPEQDRGDNEGGVENSAPLHSQRSP